ncbi:stage III sporulation protein AH [Clostridium sp. DL1XJH146]
MYIIDINSEPKDKVYRDLINLAFKVCDEFILVVRKDFKLSNEASSIMDKLQPYLKKVKKQNEWPGTWSAREVKVHYYEMDERAKEILKQEANSLYSWMQPNKPEDLCFLKNGEPWLINTAHEGESYILISDKKEIDGLEKIDGLKISIEQYSNK